MLIAATQKYNQTSSPESVFTNCKENPVKNAAYYYFLQIVKPNIE
jgi:hypothetical protein